MTANVDAMVRAGVEAFRAGNKTEARTLLEKVLELDEYNEQAWLWLSAVVDTPEEKRTCLENVLVINPKNDRARMGLKSLGVDPDALATPAASAASPFTENTFMDDAPEPSPFGDAEEFSGSAWENEDAPPTASSSASSASFKGDGHSAADYDNWIGSMGIGGKKGGGVAGPFGADEEEDIEDSGLFGSEEDDEDFVPAAPAPRGSQASASSARSSSTLFDEAEEDDLRSSMDTDEEVDEDYLSSEVMAEFDAALDDDGAASLDDLFNDKELQGMPDVRTTGEYSASGAGDSDPSELFAGIPAEITAANRLPGESESAPRMLVIGTVILVVLNIVALGFMASQAM